MRLPNSYTPQQNYAVWIFWLGSAAMGVFLLFRKHPSVTAGMLAASAATQQPESILTKYNLFPHLINGTTALLSTAAHITYMRSESKQAQNDNLITSNLAELSRLAEHAWSKKQYSEAAMHYEEICNQLTQQVKEKPKNKTLQIKLGTAIYNLVHMQFLLNKKDYAFKLLFADGEKDDKWLDSSDIDILNLCGMLFLERKNYKAAKIYFEKSLGIDPTQNAIHILFRICHYENAAKKDTDDLKWITTVEIEDDSDLIEKGYARIVFYYIAKSAIDQLKQLGKLDEELLTIAIEKIENVMELIPHSQAFLIEREQALTLAQHIYQFAFEKLGSTVLHFKERNYHEEAKSTDDNPPNSKNLSTQQASERDRVIKKELERLSILKKAPKSIEDKEIEQVVVSTPVI